MNDLVFETYNLKLKRKQVTKIVALPFNGIQFGDEWIIEEGGNVDGEVKGEQPQDEGDVGGNSSNPTLNTFDLDNIVFYVRVDDAHLSLRKSLTAIVKYSIAMWYIDIP